MQEEAIVKKQVEQRVRQEVVEEVERREAAAREAARAAQMKVSLISFDALISFAFYSCGPPHFLFLILLSVFS